MGMHHLCIMQKVKYPISTLTLHTLALLILLVPQCTDMMAQVVEPGSKYASPVHFIPNNGQLTDFNGDFVPNVYAYLQSGDVQVFVTSKGLTYMQYGEVKPDLSEGKKKVRDWERIDMQLDGAKINAGNILFDEIGSEKMQYYVSGYDDPIVVQGCNRILIQEIYPGIDWELLVNEAGFKYNFIVRAHADLSQIRLHYITPLPISSPDGDIRIHAKQGDIIERAPYSFLHATNEVVSSIILSEGKSEMGEIFLFQTGDYDHNEELIIDPSLWWCTYYGGVFNEIFNCVDADLSGNIIAVGWTESANFPTYNAGTYFQGTKSVNEDVVIVKFSDIGERLWATYYGGNAEDFGYGVSTDASGNIFVTGETVSSNFPVYNAGTYFQAGLNGDEDVFIIKFNAAGTRQWATYYGGDNKEGGYSIATDNTGNIFVTGYTKSSTFPKLNAGTYYQASMAGVQDAFMLKFSNTGTRLWATFYGGNAFDEGNALATDSDGDVFMTGTTKSTTLPIYDAGTYFQGTMAGDTDAYVIKFSNTGSRLWASYFGGTDAEYGMSVVCDQNDNVIFGGYTQSSVLLTHVPDLSWYWQIMNAGGTDMYIFETDNAGNSIWTTFFGGSGNEKMDTKDALDISGCNDLYISGTSFSYDLPLYDAGCSSYYDGTNAGEGDIWLTRFTDAGQITWSTLFGFENEDIASCLATSPLDGSSLFMTGVYHEYDPGEAVPLVNPGGSTYYDGSHNGDDECFVSKFIAVPLNLDLSYSNLCYCLDSAIVTPSCGVAPYTYLWADGQTDSIATGLCPGLWDVEVTDADCNVETVTFLIDCILPLELINFTGYQDKGRNQLQWEITNDPVSEFFNLYRHFNGGDNLITSIPVTNITDYHFSDDTFSEGIMYYTLEGISSTGEVIFSKTIAVEETSEKADLIITYPEYERAKLILDAVDNESTYVDIVDMRGVVMMRFPWNLSPGRNYTYFEHPDLPKGYYLVTVSGGTTDQYVGFYHQ